MKQQRQEKFRADKIVVDHYFHLPLQPCLFGSMFVLVVVRLSAGTQSMQEPDRSCRQRFVLDNNVL